MDDANRSGIRPIRSLTNHVDTVLATAWSPDGKTIAVACKDGVVKHWRLADGRLLREEDSKHSGPVRSIAWATNSVLATASEDKTVVIWDVFTGRTIRQLSEHGAAITSIAWAPGKELLASGSWDTTILLWDPKEQRRLRKLDHHDGMIYGLAWSPSRQHPRLASCSEDHTIRIWDINTNQPVQVLNGHAEAVRSVVWSPDGRTLVSCSEDKTIRIWNAETGQLANELHGHTGVITSLAFSHNGHFLASKAEDGTVRIWRMKTYETVCILQETKHSEKLPAWLSYYASSGPAFAPASPYLITIGRQDTEVVIHELNYRLMNKLPPVDGVVHYTNAKVVLLGNSGVGKSGLALRLTNHEFEATISSHGRKVYPFDRQMVTDEDNQKLTREIYLWDLAGQPGYRLIHQLYLRETAIAVVVFDAQSEIDPFAGVRYWDRALKQAQRIQSNKTVQMRKILVAARLDRGAIQASFARISDLLTNLKFDSYVETSAKENRGVQELSEKISAAIDWSQFPKITSTTLFQLIKTFLIDQQPRGRILDRIDALYSDLLREDETLIDSEQLRSQFRTCIELLERSNIVRRLSFGDLVLLSPEKLDSYAALLVNVAREEPDGMGSVDESRVFKMALVMPPDERIPDRRQEQLLLIATVEDMLHHELALRETGREGTYLVFPSELTRERQDLPDPQGKAVSYSFEGPIFNIYATLIVRLTHSGVFTRFGLWKNAATFQRDQGGICGLFLEEFGEGQGRITIFFEPSVSTETRYQFETFIENHLERRAIRETVRRRPIISCRECGLIVTEQMIELLSQLGQELFPCPVCQAAGRATTIFLSDPRTGADTVMSVALSQMDRSAEAGRRRATAAATLQGKQATSDYDVLLCHDGNDRPVVSRIGELLKQVGILPWYDEWDALPGRPWQEGLVTNLSQVKHVALLVGRSGMGPWEDSETLHLIREFASRQIMVHAILLPDAPHAPQLPPFLTGAAWIDFRQREPDPFEQFVWVVSGKQQLIERANDVSYLETAAVLTQWPDDSYKPVRRLQRRLDLVRTNLAHYLDQLAITGTANARPEIMVGIREARTQIAQLKVQLRTLGKPAEDLPDDER